jgi:general stress protein CsbA
LRTLLNVIALLALAFWLGSLLFFGAVLAPAAFSVLPPLFPDHPHGIHAAGAVVGTAITRLHYLGLVCGIVFLFATFALGRLRAFKIFLVQAVLVLAMILLTSYSQFSVIPRMDTARASAGGIVEFAAPENPARQEFEKLHLQSTRVEGGVLLCGLLAFCFAVRAAELPTRI